MNRPSRSYLFVFLFSLAAFAQAQNRPPQNYANGVSKESEQRPAGSSSCRRPGPPMEELTSTLGLQGDQRDALSTLLRERHEAMRKIHDQGRENAEAANAQSNAKIAKLLTPAQMAKFEQWEKSHRPPPPRRDSKAGGMQEGGPRDNKGGPGGDCPAPPPRESRQAGGRP